MAGPFLDATKAATRRRRSIDIVFVDIPDRGMEDDLIAELERRRARFGIRSNNFHAVVELKDRTLDDVMKGMKDRARYSIKRGRRSRRFELLTDDASLVAAYEAFGPPQHGGGSRCVHRRPESRFSAIPSTVTSSR